MPPGTSSIGPRASDLTAIRSVVLVDDEISTGTTLANLAAALVAALPGIERIAVATLTDWSGGGRWLDADAEARLLRQPAERALRWAAAACAADGRPADAGGAGADAAMGGWLEQ